MYVDLRPYYDVGDLVVVTVAPSAENWCEGCGRVHGGQFEGKSYVGVVVREAFPEVLWGKCSECGARRQTREGEYVLEIVSPSPQRIIAPYTWMRLAA